MDGGAFVQVKIESTSCHRLCLFVWCHWLNHAVSSHLQFLLSLMLSCAQPDFT